MKSLDTIPSFNFLRLDAVNEAGDFLLRRRSAYFIYFGENVIRKILSCTLTIACFFFGADCGSEITVPQNDDIITVEKELTDGEQPAVSPDGRKIAFTRNGDIFVCDTSGANITQLTLGAETDIQPRWHPNGQAIGFIRKNTGENNRGILFTIAANGGAATQLLPNQFVADSLVERNWVYGGIGMPIWDWSPSAGCVAFLQQSGVRTFLKIFSLMSTQEIFSTKTYDDKTAIDANGSSFIWSSEEEIAFIGQNSSGGKNAFLLNLLNQNLLVDSSHVYPYYICRNPLNNNFGYLSSIPHSPRSGIIITDFSKTIREQVLDGGGNGFKWSPDGRIILFEDPWYYPNPFGYRKSRIGIYDMVLNKQFLLTQKGDIDRVNYFFDWGKSSRKVYFERHKKITVVSFEYTLK